MICPICSKEVRCVTSSHLKLHNLTSKQFHKIYPEIKTIWNYHGHISEESVIKRTATRKKNGVTIWNKGLTKEIDERVKTPVGCFKKGCKSLKKGLNKETDESIKRQAEKMKGRIFSEEHRKKLSLSHKGERPYRKGKGNLKLRGEGHPNWKGGISKQKYGYQFTSQLKEQIRKRDSYRCQQCFRHQDELFTKNRKGQVIKRKLCIHHIDYDKLNNKPENLISLCGACHAQTGYDRNDWISYLKNKVANI